MASNSIACELLNTLDCIPYTTCPDSFDNDSHVDPEDLKRLHTYIRDKFWIDTRPFQTRRGNIIPTGVYSIFGKYNNTPAETVNCELYDWATDKRDEYTLLLGNILQAKNWKFGSWAVNLKLKSKPADEGALYCINCMYHRHTIVYQKNGFWSTVSSNKPRAEISKLCDVHLLLLGDLKYGEIRPILTGDQTTDQVNWDEFEAWFKKACRKNKPQPPIPQSTRGKCASTTPINYYDMNCG